MNQTIIRNFENVYLVYLIMPDMNIVYFPLATEQKEHFHVVSVTEDIIHSHLVGII